MISLANHMLQGDALRMEQFFEHASCHPTTQFEDFKHVNADATDETKIVTTKFVLGFCHRQLRFYRLVQISPYRILFTLSGEGVQITFKISSLHKSLEITYPFHVSWSWKNGAFFTRTCQTKEIWTIFFDITSVGSRGGPPCTQKNKLGYTPIQSNRIERICFRCYLNYKSFRIENNRKY